MARSNYISAVWVILGSIILSLSNPEILISGQQQQVPCLFIFGDELFDNGNNNGRVTTAKANYPPYGIDYPDAVPTGRFTNGYNTADFLAKLLGFNASIPPFGSARGFSEVLRGLNYASTGSGIIITTGKLLYGARISMEDQLINHQFTTWRIIGDVLKNKTAAVEYLAQCLYVVNTGSDDYINNYYQQPISLYRLAYDTPERFASFLIQKIANQLSFLHYVGARKVAVFGTGLIGCIPQVLARYPPPIGSPCNDEINRAVGIFNYQLAIKIQNLNYVLPNANFTYINATNINIALGLQGDPASNSSSSLLGTAGNLKAPCCEVQPVYGRCVPNGAVCSNRDEYAFFDNFNPTQILHNFTASRAYNAFSPADAFPFDIRTLVTQ